MGGYTPGLTNAATKDVTAGGYAVSAQQQSGEHAAPAPDRPRMPAGYGVPASDEGMLPWSHASELLGSALIYWIGSTRPDGRPHAMPLWGAWVDETFYFEGGRDTRRGRNLAANPAVVVHVERGDDIVILEGTAEEIAGPDPALAARLVDAFAAKYHARYGYRPEPEQWREGGLYTVRPRVAFAWNAFPQTTTRYRFGD